MSFLFLFFSDFVATLCGVTNAKGCAPSLSLIVYSPFIFLSPLKILGKFSTGLKLTPSTLLIRGSMPSASMAGLPRSGWRSLFVTYTSCFELWHPSTRFPVNCPFTGRASLIPSVVVAV